MNGRNRSSGIGTTVGGRREGLWTDIKRNKTLHLLFLPVLAGFVIFHYIPMYGVQIAFRDYDLLSGFLGSPWVGFKHFASFFRDPYFVRIVRNTLLLNVFSILFGFPAPIILALMLSEVRTMTTRRVIQTVTYLPHFIMTVLVVGMLFQLFGTQGIANQLRMRLGFPVITFFNKPSWFRPLYIGSDIWQGTGWGSILYLAALTGIDPELYEAAYVDGAGRLRRILHVSIPGILPTATILLILRMGKLLKVGFEKVYLMYNPAIYSKADVIATYVFRRGIVEGNFSYSTAVGLFDSVLGLLLVIATNRISKSLRGATIW